MDNTDEAEAMNLCEMVLLNATTAVGVFDASGALLQINKAWSRLLLLLFPECNIDTTECFFTKLNLPHLDAAQSLDSHEASKNNRWLRIRRRRISFDEQKYLAIEIDDISGIKQQMSIIHRQISDSLFSMRSRITSVQNALSLLVDYQNESIDADSLSLLSDCRLEIWQISRYSDNLRDLQLLNANLLESQLELELLNVKEFIELAQEESLVLAKAVGHTVTYDTNVPPNLWVYADSQRTQRIINALLSNAIQYNNGSVTIKCHAVVIDGECKISICDSGNGINPDDLPHIFEYGFRGNPMQNSVLTGMGIELFLSRQITSRMRGRITCESAPGLGAIFDVFLPIGPQLIC